MSASKRIALAVAFSWLSRAVAILANLFLLPILFRFMGKEELGLWFLLGNSQAFLGLLGLGIAPTLMRHIALAKGKSGADPEVELTQESMQHIGDLVVTGRIILQWLAVIVFFIAWGSGYGLISQLELKDVSPQSIFWAWTLMCAGYAVGVWVSYLNCWLAGIGYVGWDSLIGTAVSVLTILVNIATVLLGGGLLALAAISVVSGFVQQFAVLGFIHWRKPELLAVRGQWNTQYAKAMLKPSLYCWLTNLGTFFLYKTDQYFIAFFEGTSQVALYQSTYAMVFNLALVALTVTNSASVFISQYWSSGNLNLIHKFLVRSCKSGFLIMASGSIFLALSGKEFFELWLDSSFIGYPILTVLVISLNLDVQHGLLTGCSRATDDEKYALSGILAGLLNLCFTWFLIKRLGLIGVPLGTLIAQLLTNNWYGVYRPLVRLSFPINKYLMEIIYPVFIFTTISFFTVYSIKFFTSATLGYSKYGVFFSVLTGCTLTWFLGALFLFKLEDKSKIFTALSFLKK